MLSNIAPYAAAFIAVILAGPSLFPDYFVNTRNRTRRALFVSLVIAVAITLWNIHEGNKQHGEDMGTITNLRQTVSQGNDLQQANALTFTKAQETARQEFQKEFDKMTLRVADLQTQIKTADLQKEAAQLRLDLAATRKSMDVPKATLAFSFVTESQGDPHAALLAKEQGVVHVSFTVINDTDTPALEGTIILDVCDLCEIIGTPTGFTKVAGSRTTQLNMDFQHILAHSRVPTIEVDIRPPEGAPSFLIGVEYRCRNCNNVQYANSTLPSELSGTNTIKNP
jgi:hypothetical protein